MSVGSLGLQWTYIPTLNPHNYTSGLHMVLHLFSPHLLPSYHLALDMHKGIQLDSCWLCQPLHDTFQDHGQRFDLKHAPLLTYKASQTLILMNHPKWPDSTELLKLAWIMVLFVKTNTTFEFGELFWPKASDFNVDVVIQWVDSVV